MKVSVIRKRFQALVPGHCKVAASIARCLLAVLVCGSVLAASACAPEVDDGRLRVAVTVAPLAGIVERIAPNLVHLTVLVPPGASPVTYEPSMAGVTAASAADLYVSVGHPAFAWEETWLAGLLREGETVVIPAARGCTLIPDDPHVWLSLDCVRGAAIRIAQAMQRARPELADSVDASLDRFLGLVNDLGTEADRALGPHRGGSFLVLHPAWGYVAAAYDLHQIALLEHGSGDAGPAELADIVRRARELGLRDVLVQPEFSVESAALVASELGGRTVTVDPLARNWAEGYRRATRILAEEVRP